jgi:hypothetical protein
LCYEVALGNLAGAIQWLNGPYPCRDWPDINIFCDELIKELELSERVEADDGYVGGATKVQSAVLTHSLEEADVMEKWVQRWLETVNARLKSFHVLDQAYCHDSMQHG